MKKEITFHTRAWTVRDALLAYRLQRSDNQDVESMVALFVSRSDATEEQILALSVAELSEVVAKYAESIKVIGIVTALSATWGTPESEV